jgi:hypothetical protein
MTLSVFTVHNIEGRAIAQVVSRSLPTATARSGQMGFVVDEVELGRFSPSTSVSPANLHSTKFSILTVTRAGTIGQLVADVPSGPSFGLHLPLWKLKKITYRQIFG